MFLSVADGPELSFHIWIASPKTGNRTNQFVGAAMAPFALLTLTCLVLGAAVAAQRPVLKYGLTLSQCGLSASISIGQKQTLEWYANYTNAHGGVNISGVIHDVEFVMYAPR